MICDYCKVVKKWRQYDKVYCNFHLWLLIHFCRAEVAVSFETLWLLAQEHMSKTALLHELPPEVLRYLTQALVMAGSAEDDTAVRKKYLDQVSRLPAVFSASAA